MKRLVALSLALIGAWLSGCASDRAGLVLDTVGPSPVPNSVGHSTNGALVVYSAYEVNADFNARDPRQPEHSDYTIFTRDGQRLRQVHNNSGTILQLPLQVELPAGTYRVIAPVNGYGWVTVPVIIRPGRDTVLHLEGGVHWPKQAGVNPADTVRLPDGEIVGWSTN